MIDHFLDDDTTPLAGYVFDPIPEAGERSAAVEVHAWNNGGATAQNVSIVQQTESLVTANLWLSTGLPPQDEQWGRARIVGYDNTGDPTWSIPNTDWTNLGTGCVLLVGDVPDGCAYFYEYAIQPPGNADTSKTYRTTTTAIYNAYSIPAAAALTRAFRGILTGIGDDTHSGCVFTNYDSLNVAPSGTPDDLLHLSAGVRIHKGRRYVYLSDEQAISQSDVAAAALAAGESYILVVSVGAGTRTITKGAKAVSPTKPAAPAGDEVIAYVTVHYDAVATVIEEADIEHLYPDDRYHASDGGALNLFIGKGRSLYGETYRFRAGNQLLPLPDDATTWTWLLNSGLFDTTDTATPPEDGAQPHYKVTCAAGVITEIVDLRELAGELEIIRLRGDAPGSPGEVDDAVIGHDHAVLDAAIYRVITPDGTATTGQTILDVLRNGGTIFTDFATEDARPTFAFDAAGDDLKIDWPLHQVSDFYRGDVVSLETVEYPDSDAKPPAKVEATLLLRIP